MTAVRPDNQPTMTQVAVSRAKTVEEAVKDVMSQITAETICFALAFVPDQLDPHELAQKLEAAAPNSSFFGCSTAGQISLSGYETDALVVIAFPRAHFRCSSALFKPLSPISIERVSEESRLLAARFPHTANWRRIALVIADGLSKKEDLLVAAISSGLGDIPVFGGSAGHGLAFDETLVLHGGKAHEDAALLLLIETDLTFHGLGFDHFLPTAEHMVVTHAIPEERVVLELNGVPAAQEYARYVGCGVDDLSPEVFAENPVLVRNGKSWHVRAIQQVVEDGGLSFLSAIDDGLVLTLGRGTEILNTLERGLEVQDQGVAPDFILGFDCVLRRLEIDQKNLTGAVSDILKKHRVLGFNTYGEQHLGVHVNQTFVGVAFYPPREGALF